MRTLLLLLLAAALPVAAQTPPRVRVFVDTPTADQGFVDQALQDRLDSTQNLTKSLKGKSKWIEVVTDATQADLTVSVTSREMVATGTTRKAFSPLNAAISGNEQAEKAPQVTVLVRTRAGFETTVHGKTMTQRWSEAASSAAYQIETFVKSNSAKLLADR
jgi:hypothetical protein